MSFLVSLKKTSRTQTALDEIRRLKQAVADGNLAARARSRHGDRRRR